MKAVIIAGVIVWLVGNFILTEIYQFDDWSVLTGYMLGLFSGFIMVIVVDRG